MIEFKCRSVEWIWSEAPERGHACGSIWLWLFVVIDCAGSPPEAIPVQRNQTVHRRSDPPGGARRHQRASVRPWSAHRPEHGCHSGMPGPSPSIVDPLQCPSRFGFADSKRSQIGSLPGQHLNRVRHPRARPSDETGANSAVAVVDRGRSHDGLVRK